ncbi:DivIVA domain-containing protein [Ornithinimicrobium pratense]|uniref:Cell wall synthesis protein Wag31 n=1 Tax=Ornithinimicrobium pratense TaxID=2593973 RepID=A0A5J6V379_9MICO|nr:DivIVA domain-containing protein [Ornithinimicrobium pratense]QFG68148.1 DivIVA domain-containing protein [Ornithinimicrobium pratense]
MTLSPEDVIKKSFSATHLRRGYDETQVDDFLDEVVVELRRLLAENQSLRSDLEDCRASRGLGGDTGERAEEPHTLVAAPLAEDDVAAEPAADGDQRVTELTAEVEALRTQLASCQDARAKLETQLRARAEGGTADGADVSGDGDSAELEDLLARIAGTEEELRLTQEQLAQAKERAAQAEARAQTVLQQGTDEQGTGDQGQQAQAAASSGQDPTSIISLAQRLHDQHVAEGESTRAQLVDEAEAYRDRVTSEADQQSQELLRTGQETHDLLVTEGQERHDDLVRTGQETHDRLVTEGQERHDDLVRTGQETHDRLVTEGEQRRSSILEDLTSQQNSLSRRIEELRTQENDLRDRLRTFLTDQLAKVEADRG